MGRKKIALFSLFDQDKVILYAKQLVDIGWEIVATSETSEILNKNSISVKDISAFLGIRDLYPFPPTLHPKVELALTSNMDKKIDLVYDITYPLDNGNDVGGHTLLALAAKGGRIVVCEKEDMKRVIEELKNNNNEVNSIFRQKLIEKVYDKISKHYFSLTHNLKNVELDKIIIGNKTMSLVEGENPYQVPADLFNTDVEDVLGISGFKQVSGVSPCFTNIADFDSILKILCSISSAFDKFYGKLPYIVIAAKHGNPCGLSIDWISSETTIENALFGNPRAIWGGEVITNFKISENLAKKLFSSKKRKKLLENDKWMLDIIIAPDFDANAIKILGKNNRRKLFKNKALLHPYPAVEIWSYRMVRGGFLRQPPNNYILDLSQSVIDFPMPDSIYIDSLIIAWATSWFSNHGGNEVSIAKDRKLLGVGGGPSTIDATCNAITRTKECGHDLKKSVFAADAFFPFTDAPEELVKAGCIYGIVPEGGKNMKLIKSYFKKNKMNVFYLPEQFRGFCRH